MTRHVFTYGSLMFPEVWTRVVAGHYPSLAASLEGYARFAVRDETYPGMLASAGSTVDGVVHLDVDAADLASLDRFEGDDYRRITVSVMCTDGIVRAAETYLYRTTDRLLDRPWLPEAFAMQRFLETYCRERLGPPG